MKNWYIVQSHSSFENKVAGLIKEEADKAKISEKFEEIIVPTHDVTEVKRGKRVQRKKKYFPGYVLIKSEMDNNIYHMIKNIKRVSGFLGTKGIPVPVSDKIEEIVVPTHDVTEVKRGKRIQRKKKYFPGYVLIKSEMDNDLYHLIKNLKRVSGFLGSKGIPVPVSDKEIEKILGQIKDGVAQPKSGIEYSIGEKVQVVDGPFASFSGMVEDIDEEKSRLKVSVSIFGRPTPVDLEYNQVEKAS